MDDLGVPLFLETPIFCGRFTGLFVTPPKTNGWNLKIFLLAKGETSTQTTGFQPLVFGGVTNFFQDIQKEIEQKQLKEHTIRRPLDICAG